MIYEPREDSYLIAKHVKYLASGTVLDMGTGSGYLATEAAKSEKVKKVYAADINPEAIRYCKKRVKSKKIVFIESNLFSAFRKRKTKIKFDLIIFNPPYLPNDFRLKDIALDGGKKGNEVILKFLKESKGFLNKDGKMLLLFSSLSKKKDIDKRINEIGMKSQLIDSEKMFFEELYVYIIRKD